MEFDSELLSLLGGILGLLLLATVVGAVLRRRLSGSPHRDVADNLMARVKAWWIMCLVFAVAIASGGIGSIILFALLSFMALREYITLVPTARADHRALFYIFFLAVPIQYALLAVGWYGLFVLFIPVYCFLLLSARMVVAGDCERFLERSAKIQWGLMVCVYCVSHAPALLKLDLIGYEGENAKLMLFFVTTVEMCDVFQFTWGKLLGGKKILPSVSPGKTWSGFIGGVLTAGALGAGLFWATPFNWWQAGLLALGVGILGFCGDVTMSAVKRDANVKDYGELIPGHGGVLDRIDSLCFAAPLFFHVVRYYFGAGPISLF